MQDRRYDEAEVRRIMQLATTQPDAGNRAAASHGLTLAEVQSIGSEIGVDAVAIERAAAALDAVPQSPRRSLGMRIEVNHQAPLPRAPTDVEWMRIVSDLRSTFRAQGSVATGAGVREWRNGNLFVTIEPSAAGYRIRSGTIKGDANAVNALGATGLAAGAAVFASMIAAGEPHVAFVVPALFGASGAGAFLANMLRLPRWAEQRERQLAQVSARADALLRGPESGDQA